MKRKYTTILILAVILIISGAILLKKTCTPPVLKSKKDIFFDKAVAYDFERMTRHERQSEQISVEDQYNLIGPLLKGYDTGSMKFGDDSVFEMYELLKRKKLVAVNIAANSRGVGGSYTVDSDFRKGSGTQEEGMMGVLDGLLASNLHFAEKDDKKKYKKSGHGPFLYKKDVFKNAILFSKDLRLKVGFEVFEHFVKDNEGKIFFTDYVAEHLVFDENPNEEYLINAYSSAAFDNRWGEEIDYDRLYKDVYNQVATFLKHILENTKVRNAVITVPGSGCFANGDKEYKKRVWNATKQAIKDHGSGIEEIIMCPKTP